MAGGSWQEGVQCRLVIDLTSHGHSRSKKTVPNETSYVTSYMSIMVTNHNFRDISQNSVIMGVKKQKWPPCRHFLNQTENKWAYMLAIPSVLSAPSLKEIQLVFGGSKSVYIQDGRQTAILNAIKNLFDVHNLQTVPVLGLNFLTSWPIHFWEIAAHGQTDVRTDGRRSNYKPPFLGAKKRLWWRKWCMQPLLGILSKDQVTSEFNFG